MTHKHSTPSLTSSPGSRSPQLGKRAGPSSQRLSHQPPPHLPMHWVVPDQASGEGPKARAQLPPPARARLLEELADLLPPSPRLHELTAPKRSLCVSQGSPEVLPQLTSALRTAPPGLAAWMLAQSQRQSLLWPSTCARPVSAPSPKAGWQRSPPRCVSRGGACLRGAQPRGPAWSRVPGPSQLLAALRASGASPARRAAQGVGWEKAEGEEQGGRRFPDPSRPSAPTSPAAHPGFGLWHLLPRV